MTRSAWAGVVTCACLTAFVILAFLPALGAEFVLWDDDRNFLENRDYRGLSAQHLAWMFTTFHMGPYQPLAWVTLGLDHELWGMDARGYHLTNVVIHAAAVVAFFFLARRLFAIARPQWSQGVSRTCAVVAALAFGIHPLRVESVAWVTERRDVVSGLFFVLATWAWLGYARGSGQRAAAVSAEDAGADLARTSARHRYLLALLFFLLALLSKATVLMLPAVWLLLDLWPLQRWPGLRWHVVVEKLPFVALSAVFAVVAVAGQASTVTAMRALDDHGPERRLAQMAYSAVFHPWKTIAPTGLSPIYDMPSPFDALAPRFVVAGIAAAILCAAAWFLRRRWPAWSLAWWAFLVLLLPVSGIVATGPQLVADRYSYLACMPFALLAGGVLGTAIERGAARTAVLVATAALLVLGVLTWRQTGHWRNSESLWEHAHALDPRSAVACDHLGVVRVMQSGEPGLDAQRRKRLLQEAITLYVQAHESAPHPNQVFNLGGALMEMAQLDPAERERELEVAVETMQGGMQFARETTGIFPKWRVMYASALIQLRRFDEARVELDLALQEMPADAAALRWRARIELDEERTQDAIPWLERLVAADPRDAAARRTLGLSLQAVGRAEEARAHLDAADQLAAPGTHVGQ